jgi:oligosaccharide repeat unit polymerase
MLINQSIGYINTIILIFGIGSIFIYLLGKKKKDYFEPTYLFSIYFIFVYISAYVTLKEGLENNLFINSTYFYSDIKFTYTLALLVSFVSYFSTLAGYHLFAKKCLPGKPIAIKGINSSFFLMISILLYSIGIANFIYNIITMYSGDIISYYTNISLRFYDFADGGTTLGYNFTYAGTYMLFVRSLQIKRTNLFITNLFIYGLVFISVMIFASTGRISNTTFYIGSFLVIYYYNRGSINLNDKFFVAGILIVFLAIIFYSARYASSLNYNNMYDFSEGGLRRFIVEFFNIENLSEFIIQKGNIPNFPILMKIIDSSKIDIGYTFGATLFFPIYGFISVDFFGLIPFPAVLVKQIWYPHILGGNLPATGMGEMILNFSIIGFPFGMFLFGAMGALFRNILIKTKSNIYLILYAKFVFFFMLYSKGEFNNMNLFWMAFPSFIFLFSVYIVNFFHKR